MSGGAELLAATIIDDVCSPSQGILEGMISKLKQHDDVSASKKNAAALFGEGARNPSLLGTSSNLKSRKSCEKSKTRKYFSEIQQPGPFGNILSLIHI